jgi:hypothetical protein
MGNYCGECTVKSWRMYVELFNSILVANFFSFVIYNYIVHPRPLLQIYATLMRAIIWLCRSILFALGDLRTLEDYHLVTLHFEVHKRFTKQNKTPKQGLVYIIGY